MCVPQQHASHVAWYTTCVQQFSCSVWSWGSRSVGLCEADVARRAYFLGLWPCVQKI